MLAHLALPAGKGRLHCPRDGAACGRVAGEIAKHLSQSRTAPTSERVVSAPGRRLKRLHLDADTRQDARLRQADDLKSLTDVQQRILVQAWRMLKPGGMLLYVTCSVFKQENERQIERLISACPDATESAIHEDWGIACHHGRQLLPGDMDGDGFFFARLQKQAIQDRDTAIAG